MAPHHNVVVVTVATIGAAETATLALGAIIGYYITLLLVVFQSNCLGQSCGIHLGRCRFFISTINIEPLVLLFGRAFAFAPLYKFVSTLVAMIYRFPYVYMGG